jgi:predicted DNA-binding antitoxin AbrB/MazE fold protein
MTITVPAVYENGVFRPLEPVRCSEHERVILTVESTATAEDHLIDREFLAYCESQADESVSLESVRQALAKIPGSLADVQDLSDQVPGRMGNQLSAPRVVTRPQQMQPVLQLDPRVRQCPVHRVQQRTVIRGVSILASSS